MSATVLAGSSSSGASGIAAASATRQERALSDGEMQPIAAQTEGALRRAHGGGGDVQPLSHPHPLPEEPLRRALALTARRVPIAQWLPKYSRVDAYGDVLGGLTVSVVLIPQAIAYALLVEISPVHGLYTSFMPLIVHAVFTTSRQMCIGPFALVSLVVASIVSDIVPRPEGELSPDALAAYKRAYLDAVLFLSVISGLIQVAMGSAGLGIISSFLADPCIKGFTTAVALIIMASQLKYLLGVNIPRASLPETLYLAAEILVTGKTRWWAVLVTVASFALMYAMKNGGRRFCPKVPLFEQLVAVIAFTLLMYLVPWLEEQGVRVIGELPAGPPPVRVPPFPATMQMLGRFVQGGAVCAFTSFLVSMSMARVFATKHGYAVDANQELVALGMANIVGGMFGAYPVSGSFSRTAVLSSLGGRTPIHGWVQAGIILLVLIALTPLFRTLPFAVLAAIIFTALQSLVEFSSARALWRSSRPDFVLWVVAFVATAVFDVQIGLLLSIAASLGTLVWRTSRPRWLVLGRLPGTDVFRDVTRYPSARRIEGVLIFRFDAPLHFANAEYFDTSLRTRVEAMDVAEEALTHVVLDCSSIHTLDSSAHTVLRKLITDMHKRNVAFLIANSRAPFREALVKYGTYDELIGEDNMFLSVLAAVETGCARPLQLPEPAADGGGGGSSHARRSGASAATAGTAGIEEGDELETHDVGVAPGQYAGGAPVPLSRIYVDPSGQQRPVAEMRSARE